MSDAPKRIWAESVEGKWRNGSWAAKPSPAQFPDEREFVLATIANGYRDQRDAVIAAARKVILWAEMLEPDPPDDEPDAVDALVAVIGTIDDAQDDNETEERG